MYSNTREVFFYYCLIWWAGCREWFGPGIDNKGGLGLWCVVDLGLVVVVLFGLKVCGSGCSSIANQGTNCAQSEIVRTQSAKLHKHTSKGSLWYFLDVEGPELPIFQSIFTRTKSDIFWKLRDQMWTFFKLHFRVTYVILETLRTSFDHMSFI